MASITRWKQSRSFSTGHVEGRVVMVLSSRNSSLNNVPASHWLRVASKRASMPLESVASGPKTRKFRCAHCSASPHRAGNARAHACRRCSAPPARPRRPRSRGNPVSAGRGAACRRWRGDLRPCVVRPWAGVRPTPVSGGPARRRDPPADSSSALCLSDPEALRINLVDILCP